MIASELQMQYFLNRILKQRDQSEHGSYNAANATFLNGTLKEMDLSEPGSSKAPYG